MHKFQCDHDAFVESCPSCAELAAIERAFIEERNALIQEAQVPSSAIVWWRAQMRSRREAAAKAAEPITVVQGLAIACFVGVLAAAIGFFSPAFTKMAAWLRNASLPAGPSLPTIGLPVETLTLTSPLTIGLIAAIGFTVVVLPIALYFAFHEGE